jgi:hypothetical protein
MKTINFSVLTSAFTIAVMLASPASAGGSPKNAGMNMPVFADCDLNGDGRITEDEFLKARSQRIEKRMAAGHRMKNMANAPSFQTLDTDDNGAISREEFAAHVAEHRARKESVSGKRKISE